MSDADGGREPVAYEVTVTLADPADADRFPAWMLDHHIPDVLATGCFARAEFARLDASVFRTRYLAATRADLDRYLADHTAALRAGFEREFGAARATRQVWSVLGEKTLDSRR